jgi:hypothetical protein
MVDDGEERLKNAEQKRGPQRKTENVKDSSGRWWRVVENCRTKKRTSEENRECEG